MSEPTKCPECGQGRDKRVRPCHSAWHVLPAVPAPPQAEGTRTTDGAVAQKSNIVPGTLGAVEDSTSHGTQGSSPASTTPAPASPETPDLIMPLGPDEFWQAWPNLTPKDLMRDVTRARYLVENHGSASVRRVRLIPATPSGPRPEGASFTEDEACEDCGERRATVHLEGSVNELCAECYTKLLERLVGGPQGEARRIIGRISASLGACRIVDGYCQAHFLERECMVEKAREWLSAPARPEALNAEVEHPDGDRAVGMYLGAIADTMDDADGVGGANDRELIRYAGRRLHYLAWKAQQPVADALSAALAAAPPAGRGGREDCRVFQYDGAFKCLTHHTQWGALPPDSRSNDEGKCEALRAALHAEGTR